jgi:hypothetical protein
LARALAGLLVAQQAQHLAQLLEVREQAQRLAQLLVVLVAQQSKAFQQKMNINALTQAVCAIAVTILLTNFYNFLLYAL